MSTRKGIKRIETRTPRGIVAMVRYGQGRFAEYRVSYRHGADHWVEYCYCRSGKGLVPFERARKAYAGLVRTWRAWGPLPFAAQSRIPGCI